MHFLFPAETVHHLIVGYGYLGLGVLIFLECVGVPLPGEASLIAAAVYAGTVHGLDIWLVIAVAAGAAALGGLAGYCIVRLYGLPLIERFGPRIGLTPARVTLGRYLFQEHGGKIIFFGRFVAFLRVFAALLAGINNYRLDAYLLYNTAGALAWASIFGFAGYEFGNVVHKVARPVGIAGFLVAAVAIGFSIVLVRRHEHRLTQQAAEAMRKRTAPTS